jgi:hypothetical protein
MFFGMADRPKESSIIMAGFHVSLLNAFSAFVI